MKLIPQLSESDLARFWAKVDQSDDCWLWTGCVDKEGYGRFRIGSPTTYSTHRVSYAIAKGEPGQKSVCHSCDNPRCVNPEHLWIGVQLDNIRDRDEKNRCCKMLTIEQVREILASREIYRRLGNRYGVSSVTICDIKTGRTWNRVTGLPKHIGRIQ